MISFILKHTKIPCKMAQSFLFNSVVNYKMKGYFKQEKVICKI